MATSQVARIIFLLWALVGVGGLMQRRQRCRTRVETTALASGSDLLHLKDTLDVLLANPDSVVSLNHGASLLLADGSGAQAAISLYSKVDKTGFIGFFANYIEIAIDSGHRALQSMGMKNSYGAAIILFTLLIKGLTFPLTKTQILSTSRMQSLTPMQEKIKARYPDKTDEQTRNQLLSQLFQAANVNPLAGCLPALAQIPVFISLYRALQNLVAENKLDEPFLWIPDLEGPIYTNAPDYEWIKSAIAGNPQLGLHDTLAFLSLPLILFVSQSVSQKVLQPPKDPKKVLTEQEQFSQGLVNNLPFIVAFFSVNVPAGLAIYWIANNMMTTLITVATKATIKQEAFPAEVDRIMAMLEAGPKVSIGGGRGGLGTSASKSELRGNLVEPRGQRTGSGNKNYKGANVESGFGSSVAVMPASTVSIARPSESIAGAPSSAMETDVLSSDSVVGTALEPVNGAALTAVIEDEELTKKRKKRAKPAQQKKGKK